MEQEITLKINERYKQIALLNEQTRVLNEQTRLIIESIRFKNETTCELPDKEWPNLEEYVKDKDV